MRFEHELGMIKLDRVLPGHLQRRNRPPSRSGRFLPRREPDPLGAPAAVSGKRNRVVVAPRATNRRGQTRAEKVNSARVAIDTRDSVCKRPETVRLRGPTGPARIPFVIISRNGC